MASTNSSTPNLTSFNYTQAMVPIFDGESYDFWYIQIKTLFISQGLWDLVENGYEQPQDAAEMETWEDNRKRQ